MEAVASTLAVHHKMYAVTIPATAGIFANLAVLLTAAGHVKKDKTALGALILPASADYHAATVAGGSPFYNVPAGDSYSQPVTEFAEDTWLRAAAGGSISVVVVVYWKT